jgi:hypothetical protein
MSVNDFSASLECGAQAPLGQSTGKPAHSKEASDAVKAFENVAGAQAQDHWSSVWAGGW